jgi:acetylcholinesterase
MAPHCFFYRQDEDKSNSISDALKNSFLPLNPIDVRSFNGLNYFFGDGVIGYPIHKLVHLVSSFTDVYYYKFSYVGRYGFNYPHNKPYGVNHGDDLQYTFFDGPVIKESDPENFMVERMTKLFEYFAVNG